MNKIEEIVDEILRAAFNVRELHQAPSVAWSLKSYFSSALSAERNANLEKIRELELRHEAEIQVNYDKHQQVVRLEAEAKAVRSKTIEECAKVADHQATICGMSQSRISTALDIATNILALNNEQNLNKTTKENEMKFRKKPVTIEANQFKTNNEVADVNMEFLVKWIKDNGGSASHDSTDIYIQTLEGEMRAVVGDWIIRGVRGEFYPCKPDIFEATYEKVSHE